MLCMLCRVIEAMVVYEKKRLMSDKKDRYTIISLNTACLKVSFLNQIFNFRLVYLNIIIFSY